MAKQHTGNAALADALRPPLEAGRLEAALRAARGVFGRDPGDEDAKRVVEALELLMAQVWFGGAEEGEAADPRYEAAAQDLGGADLEGALARYEAIGAEARAERLAQRVRVVLAACATSAPPAAAIAVPPAPVFDDSTRVADDGELPLAAFDDGPTLTAQPSSVHDERTRVVNANREVTRVAADGELPLEELRREMEGERAPSEPTRPVKRPNEPRVPESSLVLDITVDELAGEDAPRGPIVPEPPTARMHAAPREPAPDPPPRVQIESHTESVPSPPTRPSAPTPEPTFVRLPSAPVPSAPPLARAPEPVPAAPRASRPPSEPRFSDDPVHAPLDTGEVALPPEAWSIREPGDDDDDSGPQVLGDPSWVGVRAFEAPPTSFEPEAAPVEADTWGEPTEAGSTPEAHAEALLERGELGEALRIYQELAASHPDEPHLWDRVAEIARLLQARSS